MTYELIDVVTGNTVASFKNFNEAWDVFMDEDDLVLVAFDEKGHAVGSADKAQFVGGTA